MKTTLIICIFAISFGTLYNSNATEVNKQTAANDSLKIDPVCKMKVKSTTNLKSTYQKQEYLFCGKGCKMKFDNSPEKYLKK